MAKTGAIAKLKAMAKDLPSYDAKALKELVASGGDVPANYKGREHVWAKKVKKFAEGGEVHKADGGDVKPYIGYRRAGRRPESQQNREASANIPVAVARGLVSGTLGLPGDIESIARLPYELITGKDSPTILPTSEDIEKRLPFRGASQTPVGQMFTGAGQLAGGAYTGPLSGARAVMAVPRAAVRAGQDFAMAAGQSGPKIFIGPKAKTWDQAKADAAARMEQEGRDPVDIWRQTGTFRGADGIMRQEISDVGAIYRNPADLKDLGKQKRQEALDLQQRMVTPMGQKDMFPKALTEARKPAREQVKRLKEEADELGRYSDVRGQSAKFVLEHPELYKAYPELADITVYQGSRGFGGASAGLMGGKGDMEVNIYQQGLRGNPRSSMLHEMQHAVQTFEDMAPGGSPSMAFQDPAAFKILDEIRAKAAEPMTYDEYVKQLMQSNPLKNFDEVDQSVVKEGYENYLKRIPKEIAKFDKEFQHQAAMEYYKRLAGEAEARATQMREPMSASQRAQEFPYSSYDVLPEDLIVKPAKGTVNALQTVYHGSPHKFDRFDASKIGTGEGAQSYGHGLYLAESPGVAKSYRRNLSSSVEVPEGTPALEKRIAEMAVNFGGDDPIAWLQKYEKGAGHTVPALTPELVASTIKKFESGEFRPGGNLYTVDLPDEKIARMLDWDKPLSQQPEVIKALKGTDYEVGISQREAEKIADMRLRQEADEWAEMTGGDPVDYMNNANWEKYVDQVRRESGSIDSEITGKELHRMVMRDEGYRPELFDPENYQIGTSEALRGYGIPGIRYLDATSRDAGKGTSNFVVFPGEEDALTILERKKEGGEVKMAKGGSTSDELRRLLGGGMKDGGAAFGRYTTGKKYQKAVKQAKEADVNTLPDPRTYAFVSGLLGSAPDQLGFSVMHPDYKGIQKAGERGFVGGTILGVAPAVAPLTKGLPVGAAIKPVGGNWLTGSVERALDPLRVPAQTDADIARTLRRMNVAESDIPARVANFDKSDPNRALNRWIDRNLTNYVKKQMATPDDPVRMLAEEGIVHKNIDQAIPNWQFETTRKKFGYPVEGFGQSQQAKDWENLTDASFVVKKAKELIDPNYMEDIRPMYREMQAKTNLENYPWLSKVDPEANIYHASTHDLGFDHIVDVLKQDLDAGRIRPEQLNKVSMEQAVRRTAEFDQEMAKKMREAQIKITEGMPVHKEYPEGYRWIELTTPSPKMEGLKSEYLPEVDMWRIVDENGGVVSSGATEKEAIGLLKRQEREKVLADALKYEGDTMGHCVGGYCPDVLAGRKRVYSLRDAKGEPHVTVEVQPSATLTPEKRTAQIESLMHRLRGEGMSDEQAAKQVEKLYPESETLSRIVQIKGKQNRAPNEQYLPFVQDFVRSGQWSDVGDFRNTGLIKAEDVRKAGWDIGDITQPYLTKQEYDDLLLKQLKPEGMKAGGAVDCNCDDEPKMQAGGIAALKQLLRAPAKSKQEIEEVARRVAPQVTGEFVRGSKGTASVAEKTQKQFAREKDLPVEFTDVKKVPPKRVVSPQELKGKVVTGIPGDPTVTGKSLVRVGDTKLELPSPQHGGPLYGLGRNDDIFWASGIGPAGGVQRVAREAMEAYDAPVVGQYIMMGPDSINYAQHFADANLQAIDLSKMSKKQIEEFNKLIRYGDDKSGPRPGFPGIEDKIDSYLHFSMDPHLRRHFNRLMQMPTVTEKFNLPSGQDIRYAVTEAPLRNMETGVTGYSMGELAPDITKSMLPLSAHPTYSHDIPGRFIGGLKYPTPYELTFPDTLMSVRANPKQARQEFGSLKMVGPRQIYDQQMIDELMMYEEAMKKYTGKKKGGKVGALSAVEKV